VLTTLDPSALDLLTTEAGARQGYTKQHGGSSRDVAGGGEPCGLERAGWL